jgi:hypothetical protein
LPGQPASGTRYNASHDRKPAPRLSRPQTRLIAFHGKRGAARSAIHRNTGLVDYYFDGPISTRFEKAPSDSAAMRDREEKKHEQHDRRATDNVSDGAHLPDQRP